MEIFARPIAFPTLVYLEGSTFMFSNFVSATLFTFQMFSLDPTLQRSTNSFHDWKWTQHQSFAKGRKWESKVFHVKRESLSTEGEKTRKQNHLRRFVLNFQGWCLANIFCVTFEKVSVSFILPDLNFYKRYLISRVLHSAKHFWAVVRP